MLGLLVTHDHGVITTPLVTCIECSGVAACFSLAQLVGDSLDDDVPGEGDVGNGGEALARVQSLTTHSPVEPQLDRSQQVRTHGVKSTYTFFRLRFTAIYAIKILIF